MSCNHIKQLPYPLFVDEVRYSILIDRRGSRNRASIVSSLNRRSVGTLYFTKQVAQALVESFYDGSLSVDTFESGTVRWYIVLTDFGYEICSAVNTESLGTTYWFSKTEAEKVCNYLNAARGSNNAIL